MGGVRLCTALTQHASTRTRTALPRGFKNSRTSRAFGEYLSHPTVGVAVSHPTIEVALFAPKRPWPTELLMRGTTD